MLLGLVAPLLFVTEDFIWAIIILAFQVIAHFIRLYYNLQNLKLFLISIR